MEPRLTATCHCGKYVSAPCPTLADVTAADAAIKALGWAWFDGVGYACSPTCAVAREAALAARQGRAPELREAA